MRFANLAQTILLWIKSQNQFNKNKKIMKKLIIVIVFLLTTLKGFTQNNGDDLIGYWQTVDQKFLIKVFRENNKYVATIYSVDGKILEKQKNNIWDLKFNTDKKVWDNGKLQLPDMNHSVDCEIKMKSKDEAIILGYHGIKLLGKERKMKRLKN
ncbi:uncharacterized protein DUF2147 [Flavobacterium croceum DSM 17960]|jgi:hypothetical protein|uniref:Uncharacterized protein DUF2147 n=2 Tax=Flavobacterium TaxID=237 RepID=A0A2S4N963_9FLAO|nr:uncharacterized protein DUF2147 [Flavobacterium croceum DSM 17960]